MRDAGVVKITNQTRIGHQVIGQQHQIGAVGADYGVRMAGVGDPRTRAVQRIDQQIRQRTAAVHTD